MLRLKLLDTTTILPLLKCNSELKKHQGTHLCWSDETFTPNPGKRNYTHNCNYLLPHPQHTQTATDVATLLKTLAIKNISRAYLRIFMKMVLIYLQAQSNEVEST